MVMRIIGDGPRAGTQQQQRHADLVIAAIEQAISKLPRHEAREAMEPLRDIVVAVANVIGRSSPGRIDLTGWDEDIETLSDAHVGVAVLLLAHLYKAGPGGAVRFLAEAMPAVHNLARAQHPR